MLYFPIARMPTSNETPISEEQIGRLAEIILVLQRCLMLRLSGELARGNVSFVQFFLLGHISSSNSLTMTEIAERMQHTTAAATGLVDRLENLGYVSRSHASDDRRKVLVHITDKGTELVSRVRLDITNNLHQVMDMLTPEEQHSWLNIYEKIYVFCSNKQTEASPPSAHHN